MQPAVSIILPTFNRLQFLPPAIESVFAQTFTQWELIIADDGSDADTRAYLQSLHDPRIHVIWLPHTGRPSVASNAALLEAHGEYVAFLDSDDLWLPAKLQTQLESLRRHPMRGWSYTKFALVDESGNPVVSAHIRDWPAPSGWILEKLLRETTVIALPSVMVSRPLLQRLGAFDEELVMCYDDELWFRLAAQSEIDGIEQTLTLVRRHGFHSGSDIIAWRDRRRVFEKALGTGGGRLDSMLRRLRAQMSAGLARSQAVSGQRGSALGTLVTSLPHTWRHPGCWPGVLSAAARACAPATILTLARALRRRIQDRGT